MKKSGLIILVSLSILYMGCKDQDQEADPVPGPAAVPVLSHSIISEHPHDTSYFTQGYEFYENNLLISTGNYGFSKLLKVEPRTGKVIDSKVLNEREFGEGITVLRDTIYQLTWKEELVHLYNAKDLSRIRDLKLNGEGWGITNDGKQLIVTNGSSNLYFYEPSTMNLIRVQGVTEAGTPAVNLNELEFVNGHVYANQWQYHYILKINPSNGEVVGKYNFTDLVSRVQAENPYLNIEDNAVLNGIAYDPSTKKFWITGKLWPKAYEVDMPH